ncbi:MAG: iron ABC transporter permease [Pseudomonadota bacterium]
MRHNLAFILALGVATLAAAPLLVLVVLADDYAAVLSAANFSYLLNTLILAALTAAGAVAIGVPLALATAYLRLPLQTLWLVLLASPLAIPSYLGAFTIYAAFGPGGEIAELTGLQTPSIQGLAGAAGIMTLYTYPFVLLTTRAALLAQDASQIQAARTLGLSLPASLWRISLPRARASIGAGALLAALYAVSDFGTPAIMNFDSFTRMIYVEYNAFGLSQAALLSLQLMVLVGLILYAEGFLATPRERPGEGLTIRLSRPQLLALLFAVAPIVFLAIVLPLGVLSLWLMREGFASFDPQIAWNSASASLAAAGLGTLAAIPVALVARRGRLGRTLERLCYFGFGIPGIVMGTALVYLGLQLPMLYQTLAVLILAYVMRFLPLAAGTIRAALDKLDGGLVSAARVLGASPGEAFRRVTLPLSTRGMLAGAALLFLEAMRELPATLLLAPTGFETLATYLWRVYEAGYFGRAAVPALLLIVLSAAGLALVLAGEPRRDRRDAESMA